MSIKVVSGGFFEDQRGIVTFNNVLDLQLVKRMYVIENRDTQILRAWQGHKVEKRWFVGVQGVFEIKVVAIDDFENPSADLPTTRYILNGASMDSVYLPEGHASSIQALEENSKLVVFSDFQLGAIQDDYKFDPEKWK